MTMLTRRRALLGAIGLGATACSMPNSPPSGGQQLDSNTAIPLDNGFTGQFVPGLQTASGRTIPAFYSINAPDGKPWGLVKLYSGEGRAQIIMPVLIQGQTLTASKLMHMDVVASCRGLFVDLGQFIQGTVFDAQGRGERLFPEQAANPLGAIAGAIKQAQDFVNRIQIGIRLSYQITQIGGIDASVRGQTGCATREVYFTTKENPRLHFINLVSPDPLTGQTVQEQVAWVSRPGTSVLMRRGEQGRDELNVTILADTPLGGLALTLNNIENRSPWQSIAGDLLTAAQQIGTFRGVEPGLNSLLGQAYATDMARAINLAADTARAADTTAPGLENFLKGPLGQGLFGAPAYNNGFRGYQSYGYRQRRQPWPTIRGIPDELLPDPYAIARREPSLTPFLPRLTQTLAPLRPLLSTPGVEGGSALRRT